MENNQSDWDQFVIIDEQPIIKFPIPGTIKNKINNNKINNNKIKKDSSIKEVPSDNIINDATNDNNNSYIELLYANSYIFRKILFSLCYFTISIYNNETRNHII